MENTSPYPDQEAIKQAKLEASIYDLNRKKDPGQIAKKQQMVT